jgi:hypothetical protein
MNKHLLTIILASLVAGTSHTHAFTTTLDLTVLSPISGGSGIFTLKVGTFQGALSNDVGTAYGQLNSASWLTGATFSNITGSSISQTSPLFLLQDVASPYSSAPGYDNSVYYWLEDTSSSVFALMQGIETYWWDGRGTGSTDVFGLDNESVTVLFGSVNTSSNGTSGVYTATAIPEPTAGSLFLLGAAGVLVLRRLRKTNV